MGLESWQLGRGRVWLRLGPSRGKLVGCSLRVPRTGVLPDGTMGSRTGRAGSQRTSGLLRYPASMRFQCWTVTATTSGFVRRILDCISNHDCPG